LVEYFKSATKHIKMGFQSSIIFRLVATAALLASTNAQDYESTTSKSTRGTILEDEGNMFSTSTKYIGDKTNKHPYIIDDLDELKKIIVASDLNQHRDLMQVACGQTMNIITADMLAALSYDTFANMNASGLEEAGDIIENFFPKLEFDVEMRKVCASCQSEDLDMLDPYCDPSAYGYDVTHSGYVFLPVNINDDGSTSIIDASKLQTWAYFRPLSRSHSDSILLNTDPSLIVFNLLAASYGLVAMGFDMTGYGDSSTLVPSPLIRVSVGTAMLPIYHNVKRMIEEESGGRTEMNDEIFFYGYSEGGYSSIAAADAFEKLGIKPQYVFAGGAPIKTSSWTVMGLLRSVRLGKATPDSLLNGALSGLPLSSTRPGVANFMQGQDALAGNRSLWLELFTDDEIPRGDLNYLLENHGEVINLQSFFSDAMFDLFSNALNENDDNPCATATIGVNDKLCEALKDQDLTDIVVNADYDIDLCHSTADNLVVIENIPEGVPIKYTLNTDHGTSALPCLVKLFNGAELKKPKMRKAKNAKSSKGSKGVKSGKGTKSKKSSKSKGLKSEKGAKSEKSSKSKGLKSEKGAKSEKSSKAKN